MPRYFIFILLSLFLFDNGFSQNKVIFDRDDLNLSPTEEAFNQVLDQKDDFAGYLILDDFNYDDAERLKLYFQVKIKEFQKLKRPKKDEKYIDGVVNFVRNNFLRIYNENASFNQLFETGFYNNVTACAIYKMTFDFLQVPVKIKETLSHVYVEVYPDTHKITIETNDGNSNYKTISQEFKQIFVSHLLDNKLIEYEEISIGYDRLFYKYYYTDNSIDNMQLMALQFYNYGLRFLEEGDFFKSFQVLQKSHVIYPKKETDQIMLMACLNYVSAAEYDQVRDYEMLSYIPLFNDEKVGEKEAVGEFYRVMNKNLIRKNDTAYVKQAYQALRSKLSEPEYLEELDFIYNYERGRVLYNKGKYLLAQEFIQKTYQAKPDNADVENLLVSNINNMFVMKAVTNEEGLVILEDLLHEFEVLKSNPLLSKMILSLYLYEMGDSFDSRDLEEAKAYKGKFESYVEVNSTKNYNEFDVGRAYSKGVIYYFRKGWQKSARSLVEDGLRYAPSSGELKERKYMLNINSN